jgi:Holliday junction DNA helicase RuvB
MSASPDPVLKFARGSIVDTYRPDSISNYIGQEDVRRNLTTVIRSAKLRGEPVDHVIAYGPAGLGKTTIARIVAFEMGAKLHIVHGRGITNVNDMIAVLREVKAGEVLFIDEGHGLKREAMEILITAMEDYSVSLVVGSTLRIPLKLDLPKFTVVMATTRIDLLPKPLQDRFGSSFRLKYYSEADIARILAQANLVYKVAATDEGIAEIAKRSRKTPRIALKLFRRAADLALVDNTVLDAVEADRALLDLGVDELGLTDLDREYLEVLVDRFRGGPVGLNSLAAAMPSAENEDEIAGFVEPYLMSQLAFVDRTQRGRVATTAAYEYLGREQPYNDVELMGR